MVYVSAFFYNNYLRRQEEIPHLLAPSLLTKPPGRAKAPRKFCSKYSPTATNPFSYSRRSPGLYSSDARYLQTNHEETVKFLPGLCLIFALEPHLEDTLERSTFLFWICT